MRRVIEDDLGERISEVFATFDEEPIAAASIGQVYRATLREDGREVAVKVQYPGVAAAVRADMQNMDMIMRLLKRMTPGMDSKAIAAEIKERIGEELDYELEAQNQRSLARIFKDHPFIVVPDVITDLSRERVLVTEFVQWRGVRGDQGLSAGSARPHRRDRVQILPRLPVPPPAVLRRPASGELPAAWTTARSRSWTSVCSSAWSASRWSSSWPASARSSEGDAGTLHRLLAESGFLPEPERVNPEHLMEFISDAIWWYTTADEVVELTPEIATQVMIESSDPRSSHFREMRHQDMRPEHLFGRRMEMLTLAVLSQLRAKNNWHRIAREWMYGEEPVTELGREEAEFYGRSGVGAAGG